MSNQSGVQAAIRAQTSTSFSYEGDWHALFTADGISGGTFNERLLKWINFKLSSSHTSLNSAQMAFAISQGFHSWDSMNTIAF